MTGLILLVGACGPASPQPASPEPAPPEQTRPGTGAPAPAEPFALGCRWQGQFHFEIDGSAPACPASYRIDVALEKPGSARAPTASSGALLGFAAPMPIAEGRTDDGMFVSVRPDKRDPDPCHQIVDVELPDAAGLIHVVLAQDEHGAITGAGQVMGACNTKVVVTGRRTR